MEICELQSDEISQYLFETWIACYLLYDASLNHANNAFFNGEAQRIREAQRKLELSGSHPVSTEDLALAYRQVLLGDVESFMQLHLEIWAPDRRSLEQEIAKVRAAVFPPSSANFSNTNDLQQED